ncbi:sigma-70 family RNA polymerase sigma factor [Oscillibacter sp.]|uniref:RNA polymerase sigma factor n=1 Tax=Oscillibacter sp. TaxID=1945593 RepID=UPI00289A5250|nr:sigma-70 family RNA polymerase sigma factor [Oscillibacter sp.]
MKTTWTEEEETRFESLYKIEYAGLLRYAKSTLQSHGLWHCSVSGRAEEVVQEMFTFAWEAREDLFSSKSPTGWLYRALYYKVLEALNEDRLWVKRMIQISEQDSAAPDGTLSLKVELLGIISTDDYLLLKRFYMDGFTYAELCEETNLKKSALAMRLKRIKERIQREYESQ